VAIDAYQDDTCAIDDAGAIECWGSTNWLVNSEPVGAFAEVSVGWNFACALDDVGGIVCWGTDSWGDVADAPADPSDTWVTLTTGAHFGCAVDINGSTECWGSDGDGNISGVPLYDGTSLDFGFGAGDTVECIVTADDSMGPVSETMSVVIGS
jgi:hypothetical protein